MGPRELNQNGFSGARYEGYEREEKRKGEGRREKGEGTRDKEEATREKGQGRRDKGEGRREKGERGKEEEERRNGRREEGGWEKGVEYVAARYGALCCADHRASACLVNHCHFSFVSLFVFCGQYLLFEAFDFPQWFHKLFVSRSCFENFFSDFKPFFFFLKRGVA